MKQPDTFLKYNGLPPNHTDLNSLLRESYLAQQSQHDGRLRLCTARSQQGHWLTKSIGPGDCPAELIRLLRHDNRGKLLDIYINFYGNVCLDKSQLANIISVHKRRPPPKCKISDLSHCSKSCTNYLLRWLRTVYCKLDPMGTSQSHWLQTKEIQFRRHNCA